MTNSEGASRRTGPPDRPPSAPVPAANSASEQELPTAHADAVESPAGPGTGSSVRSGVGVLVLQGIRLKGFGDGRVVAGRYGIGVGVVEELLLDFQAVGWVAWSEFGGTGGWSLTEAGRVENERQLAAELDEVGGREVIEQAYAEFLPLNGRLQRACTDWQLRATVSVPLAFNDHTDAEWDERVVGELGVVGDSLRRVSERIGGVLDRLRGYDSRFSRALERVRAGEHRWVDGTGIDSCHTVWFELHEDLLATLGKDRATG
jgi:hypothetical protein